MRFRDFNGNEYSAGELIDFAKSEREKCSEAGDYYFIQDFPKEKMRNAITSMNFLNNLYETDNRSISFWRID